VTNST